MSHQSFTRYCWETGNVGFEELCFCSFQQYLCVFKGQKKQCFLKYVVLNFNVFLLPWMSKERVISLKFVEF